MDLGRYKNLNGCSLSTRLTRIFVVDSSLVIRHSYLAVNGEHDHYHIEGLMESPAVDDDGDCFSPLVLNGTSVNIEIYYNKAVNYTLMVTFVSVSCLLDFFLTSIYRVFL